MTHSGNKERLRRLESLGGDIKKQREYRIEILKNEVDRRTGLLGKDTIYLIESYGFTFINCSSDQTAQIFLFLER
jgi:hypothetical protein